MRTNFLCHVKQLPWLVLLMVGLLWGMSQVSLAAAESASVENQMSGSARVWAGATYSVVFTDAMAQEIAEWVLAEYPQLPFREPIVAIHEDGITGSGYVEVWGIRVAAAGRAAVFVENGRLYGQIEEMEVAGVGVPGPLLGAIDEARELYEQADWEIVVTNVELREGEMLVERVCP
ncbi:MAG: hypothetical protein R6X34_26190 [Chloroflexota bacterium]